ncbi:MAG: hypothetical protein Q7N87_01600 [Candidatus Uhrbacteria bacterium]|nr:hypothetical protein [Candidatus Uhrbacteria bacterium]
MTPHPHIIAQCPMCQADYAQEKIHLVGERGNVRLFHCTCDGCGHAMLAIILESSGGLSSLGLVTDLEAKDALRFQKFPIINADECVGWHEILEGQSREVCRVLMKQAAS